MCRNAKNPVDVSKIVFYEIPKYFKEKNLQFAFVFDQHNGITPGHRGNEKYPYCWLEKRMQVEHGWKKCGVLVLSASANNEYVLELDLKNQTFRRLDNRELCFTGFSDDEFTNWKTHHKFFHEESDDNKRDWESVNAILSKWPLLLDDLRQRAKDTTIALQLLAELEKYRTERLAFLSQVEESHYNRVTASDKQKQSWYNEMVFAMYVDRGGDQFVRDLFTRTKPLLNKHIMFWDANKAQFFCINNLARQVFVERYLSQTTLPVKEDTIRDILSNSNVPQSVKGSVAEIIIISAIRSVLEKGTLSLEVKVIKNQQLHRTTTSKFLNFVYTQFLTQGVDPSITFSQSLLLVPKNSNYPGVDFIFFEVTKEKVPRRTLTFFQVTVGPVKEHGLLSKELEDAWMKASKATTSTFVWIAPNEDFGPKNNGHYHLSFISLGQIQPLLSSYEQSS